MRVGRLKQRITIQTATESLTDAGELSLTWIKYAERWADIRADKSGEQTEADRTAGRARYKVVVRYDENLTPRMRVIWGAKVLDVEGITSDWTARQFNTLTCTETT